MKPQINKQTPPDYYPGIDDPLPWHPYANLLPECTEDELNDLANSIRDVGQIEPVVVYQGQILDGRHRDAAIAILNLQNQAEGKPLIRLNYGHFRKGQSGPAIDAAALNLVKTSNLIRRNCNFTKSQRAAIALAIEEEFAKIARSENKIAQENSVADLRPGAIENKSSYKAAQTQGISPRIVQMVKAVNKESPELLKEVIDGKTSVNAAYNAIKARSPKPKKEPVQQSLPLPDPKKLEIDPDEILIGFVSNLQFIHSDRLLMALTRISEERPETLTQFLQTYEQKA